MANTYLFFSLVVVVALLATALPSFHVEYDLTKPDDMQRQYPLNGRWTLRSGKTVPTPYHAFSGDGKVVLGYQSAKVANDMLKEGGSDKFYQPLLTSDGQALGLLWLMDYFSTGIGPYKEIVYSFIVVPKNAKELGIPTSIPCDSSNPFCTVVGLGATRGAVNHAHKLWLDSQVAIDYGREILGLDKHAAVFDTDPRTGTFVAKDLIDAKIRDTTTIDVLSSIPQVLSALGLRAFIKQMASPNQETHVTTRPGIADLNPTVPPVMRGILSNDPRNTLRPVDSNDVIKVSGEIAKYGFRPAAINHIRHLRFFLGNPLNSEGPDHKAKKK